MHPVIPTRIVPSPDCLERTPSEVTRDFRRLLASGVALRPVGTARQRPRRLLSEGYTPKHAIRLFDTTYYLTNARQNYYLRFFVAYVVQDPTPGRERAAHPRIFYKDASLIWRSASHVGSQGGSFWVGKGDVATLLTETEELTYSLESTTDLPLEIQPALERLNQRRRHAPTDEGALDLILRRAPDGRIEPYRDFLEPRRRARANARNRIHGGRRVAWFARRNDPASLRFARGFEPDFDAGVLEEGELGSRLYGGRVRRFRILSTNRRIQYLFMAAPRVVWIVPPQATTTELSSYGVRTIDVAADEDLFVPGYEYHFVDEGCDPPLVHSQIPPGYAGAPCPFDDARADASPWLDRLPVIQAFRRKILGRRRGRRSPRRGA
jgi:hypothetical protein